jgi:hypothetical protein
MSWQAGLPILSLSILLLGVWVGALFFIPWCEHGRFRYKLWRIRDEVTDDLIDGRLPDVEAVQEMVLYIDHGIRYANEYTFASFLAVLLNVRLSRSDLKDVEHASWDSLSESQRERLASYQRRIVRAHIGHLWTGSLLGWIGVPISMVLIIGRAILTRSIGSLSVREQRETVVETFRHSVTVSPPDLWVFHQRHANSPSLGSNSPLLG